MVLLDNICLRRIVVALSHKQNPRMHGDPRMSGSCLTATHQWILFMLSETVAVLVPGDDARDGHQSSIAILSYTTCI